MKSEGDKKKKKKWFDQDCMTMKNKVRFLSIKKNQSPTNTENRSEHRDTLKEYKKLCESGGGCKVLYSGMYAGWGSVHSENFAI